MGGQGSKPSSPRAGSPKAAPPPREPVASDAVPLAPPTPDTSPAPEPEPAAPEARAVRAVIDPRWAKVSDRFAEISDRLDAIERRLPAPAGGRIGRSASRSGSRERDRPGQVDRALTFDSAVAQVVDDEGYDRVGACAEISTGRPAASSSSSVSWIE